MEKPEDFIKGRGAQINSDNRFLRNKYTTEHIEGQDEPFVFHGETQYLRDFPKKIVNKVESPDLGMMYSMNPYQGCEHGCIYCYARNSHEYWGYSAGLDFERKIIVKHNAPTLLQKQFNNSRWKPYPIMLSGNTDCYQPAEREFRLTRRLLEICLEYRHPVGLITKNSLVLRDIDLLAELAKHRLVHVSVSIASLNESLRLKLEPRTTTYKQRLQVIEKLTENQIPVHAMMAPIIPSLNSHELPELLKTVAQHGALGAAYTIVRLNGAIGGLFSDWIHKVFPDRAEKVLNQIKDCHGGQLNDSRFGTRMRGEGKYAREIADLFKIAHKKYLGDRSLPELDLSKFRRPYRRGQLSLF